MLVEISPSAGLHFWHDNGMTGELYFCETVGPGSAFLDFDGDGDLDIFLPQGHLLGADKKETDRTGPSTGLNPSGGRLYRNEGVEAGIPRFTDVTDSSGIVSTGYGMGCAVGDVDGDGDVDLYLTCFGADQLWINQGDGTFIEQAHRSGLGDDRWNTSAIFCDLDRDGDVDLFVCSYVDFTLQNHKPCFADSSAVEYCGPSSYPPLPDRIYRNRGDGVFDEMTSSSGIGAASGAGLGVISSDLDGDGELDIYVANDGMANRLWRQVAPFQFEDVALLSGCAVNRNGMPEASMGATLADFDGDGDEDIFLTHLTGETNTLYRNDGEGFFDDQSARSGLGIPSRRWTGFGTAWFDLENDGWLDVFIANGAVKRMEERVAAGDPYPLAQPDQLFINQEGRSFTEIDPQRAQVLSVQNIGRGAAFGDIDNDGDTDILVNNNAGQVRLLQNRIGSKNSWLGIELRGSNRQIQEGIRCEIRQADRSPLIRSSRRGGSYLCSNDPRIQVGLGRSEDPCTVVVHWPDGTLETFPLLQVRRYHTLARGEGK
ncbi:MAG: CRTAC1 family protein [Planctomycetota bacterium]|nr:CRTAC1 family protein [Planctomycetota bacterium]